MMIKNIDTVPGGRYCGRFAGIMSDWGEGSLCGRAEQGKGAGRKCDVVCEERLAKP